MKLAVIVATAGRKGVANDLVVRLEQQRRRPDHVIISAPSLADVDANRPGEIPVSYVFGSKGLCAQRNRALSKVLEEFDVITFLDDDFVPSGNYFLDVEREMTANPDWAVLTGNVVLDGSKGEGFLLEDALSTLQRVEASPPPRRVVDHPGVYGCNMSVRAKHVGSIRFDERLPLYGWQEDIDFSSQLRKHGRVVALSTLLGVHLGLKAGKLSGLRFGYSQVANIAYLICKGTVGPRFGISLMLRNVVANMVRSVHPERHIDRPGRLRGNLLAFCHLARGRIEPEHILRL